MSRRQTRDGKDWYEYVCWASRGVKLTTIHNRKVLVSGVRLLFYIFTSTYSFFLGGGGGGAQIYIK
jgi:hypothetical protein